MASKMLHTCLRVENLEKSIAFYQDAFGFKELRRKDFPDYAFTIVYLGLDGDDYELELTYNYDHGPYVVGDGFAHQILRLSIRNIVLKVMKSPNLRVYQVIHQTITLLKILMATRSK